MASRRAGIGLVMLVCGAAILGVACGRGTLSGESEQQGPPEPSGEKIALQFFRDPSPVVSFVSRDLQGREVSSSTWHGKVTIVNFWATWCPPCRAEIPDLIALQEKYRDSLQIVGVSEDDDPPEKVQAFVAENKMNYPVVMTTPEIRRAFPGVSALPTSFIVDRKGRIVQRHVGMLNPQITEAEARSLAGLSVNASIEEVDKDKPVKLANAAQVTSIPGIDLTNMPKDRRLLVIQKLNEESCTCGCNQTVARCRVEDPKCNASLPRAKEILAQVTGNN